MSAEPQGTTDGVRRRFAWWGALGMATFGGGLWLLAADVPAWNTLWYLFGWYGWLLLLDAWLARHGRSWLAGRRLELGLAMSWSIPFWYLFEAYNLRLANWYYVFALRSDAAQLLVSLLAFGTVIPACLLHAEVVAVLWPRAGAGRRPLVLAPARRGWLVALAVSCAAAPLLWPRVAFPLVWFAPLWIAELACLAHGAPSLLRDLAAGRPQRLLHLLAGGLLAGVVWELLNYWARCKWIYTVPYFDRLKLFEMPLLGFLGFPVLALSAAAVWSLLANALGVGAGGATGATGWPRPRPAVAAVGTLAAVLAAITVFPWMLRHTVESRRPLLAELEALGEAERGRLREAGISTPERLERAVAAHGVAAVAARAGVPPLPLTRAAGHAALAVHKGMGARPAGLLLAAGVADVRALGASDPRRLHARLADLSRARGEVPPRPQAVAVWVLAARGHQRPRR